MTDEKKLESIAARLGTRAESDLNVERVATRVVQRLREEGSTERGLRASERPLWQKSAVRLVSLAAMLAVVIGGSVLVQRTVQTQPNPLASVVPMALDELSEAELTSVLDSLQFEAPVSQVSASSLGDLSEAELQELLAMLED